MSAVIGNPLLLPTEGYQISRSVRLRSSASAYFSRTPSVSGNMKTWTWSAWVKRGLLSQTGTIWGSNFSSGGFGMAFGNYSGAGVSPEIIGVTLYAVGTVTTSAVFRDPSAWYHIVARFDSTQATQANRFRLYVNNVQQTLSGTLNVTLNADYHINASGRLHTLGGETGYANDCYLADVNHIDGQSLDPSAFGETDVLTGVWKPKKYTGTYGTNGFYLNFSDNSNNSSTTIGKDYSGNGNNWTPNNISVTAGATYDSMLDVPTLWADGGNGRGNYAVLNPLAKNTSQTNVIDGNLYAIPTSGGSNWGTVFSSIAIPTSGKWYIEGTAQVYAGSGNNSSLGVVDSSKFIPSNTAILYQYTTGEGFDGILAHLFSDYVSPISDGVQGTNITGLTGTSINLMLALDVDNGKVYAGYNGTWLNSGNPAGGTGEVASRTFSANDVVAGHTSWNGTNDQSQYYNFGQRPFAYTPPTGFKALNTQNLPDPTIKKGNQYFDISTWTGDQSARTITNSGGMQPDFLWTKSRSAAEDHRLSDAVRGGNGTVLGTLASNTTGAEAFDTDVTGFTSSGFNIRAGTNSPNVTGRTYVGWQWKESATAGFDIVTYTGTGVVRTVAHNLGVAPQMIIQRARNVSAWIVYHVATGNTGALQLQSTGAFASFPNMWNNTTPSSTVFTLGSDPSVNGSGNFNVAYLFAEVAGFSKFGSYTGNGSSDGPFVFCGFKPRWVMIKRTDTAEAWTVVDTSRTTTNKNSVEYLIPNSSGAEFTDTNSEYDILSNGFKLRDTGSLSNGSGGTYIYAAFAENPFKLSLAR